MLSSKSLPIPTEGLKNNSRHIMTLKPSSITSNDFFQNTRNNQMHSSSVISNTSTANYNQSTPHFVTNSSFVIRLLGKRSTDNFPKYISNEIQLNNLSKSNVNYDRPQSINSIDRIDMDDKKLNNSKSFKALPNNDSVPAHKEDVKESERTKSANSSLDLNYNNTFNVVGTPKNSKTKKNDIKTYDVYSPPAISRKNITICVILVFCVAIAVGINFINLNSDYEDLMDFYKGYMGRRLLIVEGRLTSKSHIMELKAKEQIKIELGPQVNIYVLIVNI